jgi:hypothetical protein
MSVCLIVADVKPGELKRMLGLEEDDPSSPIPEEAKASQSASPTKKRPARRLAQRKDPIEEYFSLVTQAVKLNSPYMDTICTIPTKELFDQAIQGCVPFHRWHIWCENQLTNIYIKTLYASKPNAE